MEAESQNEDFDEIDRIVSKSAKNLPDAEDVMPLGVITWTRIPVDMLEGVMYEPSSSLENQDEEFDTGNLRHSMMITKDGDTFPCAWDIDTLEKELINIGIVAPSIREQKEKL